MIKSFYLGILKYYLKGFISYLMIIKFRIDDMVLMGYIKCLIINNKLLKYLYGIINVIVRFMFFIRLDC